MAPVGLALATVVDTVWSAVALAGSVAAIGLLAWAALKGNADREAEDEARAFYDLHGRWPDDPA